jgi:hypothetical protein
MGWGDSSVALAAATGVMALTTNALHAGAVMSAEDLREVCTRPVEAWVSFCNGYAQATADFATMSDLACIPDGTSRTEIVTLIDELAFERIAAGDIPSDIPAFAVTMSVLQTLFPCDTDDEGSQ